MQKMKPALKKTLMAVACLSAVPAAQAAVSLDRTRAIFNGDEKSMTLNIANDNKQLPYLAQAWVENEKKEKNHHRPDYCHSASTASGTRLKEYGSSDQYT